jgi:predicted nicotinamide N-methyase
MSHEKDDETAIEEEDWSDILATSNSSSIDDAGFARHDALDEFSLPMMLSSCDPEDRCVVKIASVSSLSPLDMINLSWGTHDATGHRIWLGAQLFLSAIPRMVPYLEAKSVLELGAGTGITGTAVAKTVAISHIVITDASLSALELCRMNCHDNQVGQHVQIKKLCWGDTLNDNVDTRFDTVIAADVLYDLNMWQPLLETASGSLNQDGILILSHVPRAAIPPQEAKKGRSIEDIILHQATSFGFDLISTVHPRDIPSMAKEEREDMQEIGATIFVWKYSAPLSGIG